MMFLYPMGVGGTAGGQPTRVLGELVLAGPVYRKDPGREGVKVYRGSKRALEAFGLRHKKYRVWREKFGAFDAHLCIG